MTWIFVLALTLFVLEVTGCTVAFRQVVRRELPEVTDLASGLRVLVINETLTALFLLIGFQHTGHVRLAAFVLAGLYAVDLLRLCGHVEKVLPLRSVLGNFVVFTWTGLQITWLAVLALAVWPW